MHPDKGQEESWYFVEDKILYKPVFRLGTPQMVHNLPSGSEAAEFEVRCGFRSIRRLAMAVLVSPVTPPRGINDKAQYLRQAH